MPVEYYDQFGNYCLHSKLTYVETGYFKGKDWNYQNIIAPYNRLYIVLDGYGYAVFEHQKLRIEKGHAYVIPANVNFSCHTNADLEKIFVHFTYDTHYLLDLFEGTGDYHEMEVDPDAFTDIVPLLNQKSTKDYLTIKHGFDEVIYRFVNRLNQKNKLKTEAIMAQEILNVYRLISNHLSADLKTTWLAHQMGMSPSSLSHMFRRLNHKTLKSVIQEKIMERAKIQLLTSDKRIQEIAIDLGYKDTLYFSKAFKKMVGQTPSDYKKINRTYN